jgi:plastocyanin
MKPIRAFLPVAAVAAALLPALALAEATVVAQKDKKFSTDRVEVKVGDSVEFRNDDPFFHNVFSLSDAATFDLGSYPQGESKSVSFDTAGTVDVECAIHPSMKMTIEVKP